LLRGIQLGLPAILNNSLATYQSVATIITCYECVNVPEVGVATKNFRMRFVRQWLNPPF